MKFGKHKGELVKNLPPAYLRWLLKSVAMSDDLEKAVKEALAEIALLIIHKKELHIDDTLLDQWLDSVDITPEGVKPSWIEFQLLNHQRSELSKQDEVESFSNNN